MIELKPTERRRAIVQELRSLANKVQSLLVVDPDPEEQGEVLPVGVKLLGATGCCWIYYEPKPHRSTFEPTQEQMTELLDLVANWFGRCVEAGSFCEPRLRDMPQINYSEKVLDALAAENAGPADEDDPSDPDL